MELDWSTVGKVAFTISLLGLGLALTWIATKLLPTVPTVVSGSLIIAPVVTLFLFSGAISDFSGFGVSAKFNELAKRPITRLLSAEDLALSDKLANDPNYARDAMFAACRPYYILRQDSLPSKDSGGFAAHAVLVAKAILSSLTCGQLEAVLVLDKRGKVLGFFEPDMFRELVAFRLEVYNPSPEEVQTLQVTWENLVTKSELGVILRDLEVRAESDDARHVYLNESASIIDALRAFQKENVRVAVITNPSGEFKGIVTWQRVVNQLLLDLAHVNISTQ